ncbi:MAG: helix-turn-helix domain-containing protein [Mariniphaga sp.]|nr:helix-turn-helix domain-containing protein [Mariniphaga sp.]
MQTPTFENLPRVFSELDQKVDRIERMLLLLVPQAGPEALLNITQGAEFVNLAVPTIYSLVSRGEIPVNKKGKRLYFLKSELTAWIRSGRRKTIAESQENPESHLRTPKRRAIV